MPYVDSPVDGVRLYYRDYRPAQNVTPYLPDDAQHLEQTPLTLVFLHAWPMNSRMWESYMVPLCEGGRMRCIGLDRRGFGKSEWTGNGGSADISYETLAADVIGVLEQVQPPINDFVFVAASMAGGESLLAWHNSPWVKERCKGFIWVVATLPHAGSMQQPIPWEVYLQGLRENRAGFTHTSIPAIFGTGEYGIGLHVDAKQLESVERMMNEADYLAMERVSLMHQERDLLPELKKLAESKDVKILQVHGDSDFGTPLEGSAKLVQKELMGDRYELKVYEKGPHGLSLTHEKQLMEDIRGFLKTIK